MSAARFTERLLDLAARTTSGDTWSECWRMLRRRADRGCDLAYRAICGDA